MATSRAHVLTMPPNFLVLRIFELVVAVIVLGLTAYGVAIYPFNDAILGLFTSIATVIILIYILVATHGAPAAYNYWAFLSLEIFALIFWLVSMALLAVLASDVLAFSNDSYCDAYGYCYSELDSGVAIYGDIMAAAAGLSGLEFVLFIVSLVVTSVMIHRHRKAGGHCKVMPGEYGATAPYNPNQNVGAEKYEMQPDTQAYPVGGAPPQQQNMTGNNGYAAPPQQYEQPPMGGNPPAQQYQPGVVPQ